MYTIEDIYNRLNTGANTIPRSGGFTEPTSGPGSTGRTLSDVMGKTPVIDNSNGAEPTDVLSGKTYWGLINGHWGAQTGSGDTDLKSENIKDQVEIFGVTGSFSCPSCPATATGDAEAADVLSGKTFSNSSANGISGSMPNKGNTNITPNFSAGNHTIPTGYYNGSGAVLKDSDLVASNIACDVTISGVTGTYNCPKLVFITSITYDGNLGGLTGADSKCQARASAAGLSGTFKAWVSDSSESPSSRFNKYLLSKYALVDGTVIADNWNDLIDGTIQNKINKSENGNIFNSLVWTNTKTDGTVEENSVNWSCNNLTSNGGSPYILSTGSGAYASGYWSSYISKYCSDSYRLYCFQQ